MIWNNTQKFCFCFVLTVNPSMNIPLEPYFEITCNQCHFESFTKEGKARPFKLARIWGNSDVRRNVLFIDLSSNMCPPSCIDHLYHSHILMELLYFKVGPQFFRLWLLSRKIFTWCSISHSAHHQNSGLKVRSHLLFSPDTCQGRSC